MGERLTTRQPVAYPDTRQVNEQDTLAGLSFPDPYRWLEQDTAEVRSWQSAQAELASGYVRQWPHFDRLRELVAKYSTPRFAELPRFAGGHWFRTSIPAGASQAQVLVADEPMGEGRVLFDPVSENATQPPFLSWISPSPDGRTLALGVCADGSEQNTIRLVDVATGELIADPPREVLMDNWLGGVHWLPDSSGFFFTALTGAAVDFTQVTYLHRRTPRISTELVQVDWTTERDWPVVMISPCGRYAIALERIMNPIPVAIAELSTDSLHWQPFVTSIEATLAGHIIGNEYIAVTDVNAPRGRVVAIDLDADNPNDPACWRELVPESNAVIRTIVPVGDTLYLTEFVDTYARVRVINKNGNALGEVPLPGQGALVEHPFPLMSLVPQGHPNQFLFGFSTLTVSAGIYRHLPSRDEIETLRQPQVQLDNAVVADRRATSADGTPIPYHLIRRTDLDISAPAPTLVYAYGGFNAPWAPSFPGAMAAFVAAGGVFIHAHLRGGGEFGLEWWRGGRLRNKQNCYADLYAVAEDLIATGVCTPQSLAVTGGSNGGLMAGVAVTQRPELWAVAVPRVPLLDLIGACRDGYGRGAISLEYADVEDPEEVQRLATFSPYHLVRDGVRYPAVFLDAGDTDPRCPPWHARKFAARLQNTNSGDAPVLLRIWENVGHGWATDKEIAITEHTEWLAFTMRHLGLEIT